MLFFFLRKNYTTQFKANAIIFRFVFLRPANLPLVLEKLHIISLVGLKYNKIRIVHQKRLSMIANGGE